MIYFNFFGRVVCIISNFIMIVLFNRFYNKETFIDEGISQEKASLIKEGNDESSWPLQSLKFFEPIKRTNTQEIRVVIFRT